MSGVLPKEIVYPKLEHFLDNTVKYAEEIAEIKLRKALESRADKL